MRMKLFDAHAHIASSPRHKGNATTIIEQSQALGVRKIVDCGIDIRSSKAVLELYEKYPKVIIPTAGLHPELLIPGSDIYEDRETDENKLVRLWIGELEELFEEGKGKFKAVGECGLDFHWIEKNKKLEPGKLKRVKRLQERLFLYQIELANKRNLPIVVHSRGAEQESWKLLKVNLMDKGNEAKALFHCYTGAVNIARDFVDAGHYISFNNIITYPSAGNMREMLRELWKIDKSRILTETDSPYLPPQHKRGEICIPGDVKYVVEKVAEVVEEDIAKVAGTVFENAERFFRL